MAPKDPVAEVLGRLQSLVRLPTPDQFDDIAGSYVARPDPGEGEPVSFSLNWEQRRALEQAVAVLGDDPRFEVLKDIEERLRVFVARCIGDRSMDHVPAFICANGQELMTLPCFFPVQFLTVSEPTEAFGVTLLPPNHESVPESSGFFRLVKPVGAVAAVEVSGSGSGKMADRGRAKVERALRLLRIALRKHRMIHDKQLRFTPTGSYAFGATGSGWRSSDDEAYDLGYAGELVTLAESSPLAALTIEPESDLLKKADLATCWMERAWMTGDRLVAMLYLFFALEALLGDRSEGLKAEGIAFRQMMLGHLVEGQFSRPDECWYLYDRVRSGAVHGEDAPDVDEGVLTRFTSSVRQTLDSYLTLANRQGFQKRSRLLRYLAEHQDRGSPSHGSARTAGSTGMGSSAKLARRAASSQKPNPSPDRLPVAQGRRSCPSVTSSKRSSITIHTARGGSWLALARVRASRACSFSSA